MMRLLWLFLFLFTSVHAQDDLLNKKLWLTREVLTRPTAKKFISEILWDDLKIENAPDFKVPRGKYITETQMMILMDCNEEYMREVEAYVTQVSNKDAASDSKAMAAKRKKWKEKFETILSNEEIRERFRKINDPTEPYEVTTKQGFDDVKTYVNHERIIDGKELPPDDLKQVWIDEIKQAKKEIAINVFDFDLEDVADELIAAQKRGVKVKVGIDAGVIEARPEVKAVYKKLKKGGVFVHAVDSVGLNHQKMMAIDWSVPKDARVVLSSGNLTQSCLGPEGDAVHIPKENRPFLSKPNANHVMTMKSDVISSIVAHEISKTVDPGFQLRGKEYPIGGAYKIWGGPKGATNRSYIILAFSPNGAMDNINKNFIAQAILRSEGPIKMAQFAYSSQDVDAALLQRAKNEIDAGRKFIFKSVGDTPFAMQEWSQFLKMSGLELIRSKDKDIPPKYIELTESEWKKILGEEQFEALKKDIKVAPGVYGNHHVTIGEESLEITSKIHHKLLLTGEDGKQIAITGSFNFSAGAESNQEYILITNDERITKQLDGAVEYLHAKGKNSVIAEAIERNIRRNFDDAIAYDEVEKHKTTRRPAAKPKSKKCGPLVELVQSIQP